MSEHEPLLPFEEPEPIDPGRRRSPRRRLRIGRLLAVLVVVALIGGGLWWAGNWALNKVDGLFADAPDYPGPGNGSLIFEVAAGDTTAQIGRNLKSAGVVESVDAFTAAAKANSEARSIQVGFYELKKEMRAADALAVLVDPSNLLQSRVTIPEGSRVSEIVAIIAKRTDISKRDLHAALKDPSSFGLPEEAEGNPEGYLFPATYEVPPGETATGLLARMVDRWRQSAEKADLDGAAARLGYTPHELMTIASLVEAEANRDADRAKVARVIYNRLETPGAPTYGKLEIDATINYASGKRLGVALTQDELAIDSPYNTRIHTGLPPGPIGSPGDAAIEAAAHPADGPWFFYVTTNLRTGETKFAATYQEFLKYKAEYLEYCKTSDAC